MRVRSASRTILADLLPKANICRRPRIALSEIAEPGVRAQIGYGLLTDPEGRPVGVPGAFTPGQPLPGCEGAGSA